MLKERKLIEIQSRLFWEQLNLNFASQYMSTWLIVNFQLEQTWSISAIVGTREGKLSSILFMIMIHRLMLLEIYLFWITGKCCSRGHIWSCGSKCQLNIWCCDRSIHKWSSKFIYLWIQVRSLKYMLIC